MKTFGFAGWSGSGKTTLIEKLIPRFTQRGLRVSLIKHAHHTFDVDKEGKDSYRHRQAGATEILVTSSRRWVLMHELRGAHEPTFEEQVKRLSPCDLLLVERNGLQQGVDQAQPAAQGREAEADREHHQHLGGDEPALRRVVDRRPDRRGRGQPGPHGRRRYRACRLVGVVSGR